jgi:hypothetical protein
MTNIESIYGADFLDSAEFEYLLAHALEKQRAEASQN